MKYYYFIGTFFMIVYIVLMVALDWAFPDTDLKMIDGQMCDKPAYSFERSRCYQPTTIVEAQCEVTPLTK